MANLFGKNKLREIADKIGTEEISDHLAIIQKWHHDYHKGTLRTDKETSREQAYNQDFFINILGYKEKPENPYSFEPKATTSAGQLPDAIVGHLEQGVIKDDTKVAAVIELKGAAIVLDKPQRRDGNMSPVQQGFKYKTQYKHCPFVMVSNFYEFRLYQDNQLDYEVWTLDDLVDPADDHFKFKSFYQLLRYENFVPLNGGGKSKTEELLSEIRIEQEEIGKKFYKAYEQARIELLRDMYKNNAFVRKDINFGIEKAQKIIDRIVFACFAEDRGLLPDNTLAKVLQVDESAFGGLWDTLKGFFNAIDSGSQKLEIPDGYNGGLFATDPKLNSMVISDEPLKHLAQLSRYDFEEELSVQILGHIFEQSISDLEEIKQKAEKVVEETQEKTTSKRKKEGIFYTPDYIVRYIVESSLGTYLREAEEKCKGEAGLKGDINDKNYGKRERQAYLSYQKTLQSVTVCDPACGSGAFLVYVFDYLLAENQRVSAIINPDQASLLDTDTYFKSILENNIYGVDLNSESVEITKLSLWLKSAQKGKKLTSLNDNIKCGNSLIDDPEFAGDKSFSWQEKFPQIFKKGGFDIVVGNPPYVRVQNIASADVDYYFDRYRSPVGKLDLSILFFEKGLEILQDDGRLSYVSSSQWMQTGYGKNIRRILSGGQILEVVDFGSLPVFSDADTYPAVFTLTKAVNSEMNYTLIRKKEQLNDTSIRSASRIKISHSELGESAWQFGRFNLIEKLSGSSIDYVCLGEIGRAYIGDLTGMDKVFVVSRNKAENLNLEEELLYPYAYRGNEINRFAEVFPEALVIYPYEKDEGGKARLIREDRLAQEYPNIYAYLSGHIDNLKRRLDSRKLYATNDHWFRHLRPGNYSYIEPEKLLFKGIGVESRVGILRENTAFNGANCPAVIIDDTSYPLHFIAAILNSRVITYYLNSISPKKLGGYYRYSATNISSVPIVQQADNKLTNLSSRAFVLTRQMLENSNRVLAVVKSEFGADKLPSKHDEWWKHDFAKFTKSMKVKASLQQKDELFQLFDKYSKVLIELDDKLKKLCKEIDQLVYELYCLTPEEITIIENS